MGLDHSDLSQGSAHSNKIISLHGCHNLTSVIIIIIIIKLPDQAIASTPSAPRPPDPT
jgi:hypothetical protein